MRSLYVALVSLLALQVAQCRDPEGQRYQAPRRPGESVLSWADAYSSGFSTTGECPEGEIECNSFYLGKKEHREALAESLKTFYEYVALLDFDYDPTPVQLGGGASYTRLKVYQVLEEYLNLLPDGKWDEIVVAAQCDKDGHCIVNEGRYPMPLWSGVNLVFGRLYGCEEPRVVTIPFKVFAVEDGLLYDFFGFATDWEEMRAGLLKAGDEASKTRPEACTTVEPAPPPPEPLPLPEGPRPLPDP